MPRVAPLSATAREIVRLRAAAVQARQVLRDVLNGDINRRAIRLAEQRLTRALGEDGETRDGREKS